MEGKSSLADSMITGEQYDFQDLEGEMQLHQQQDPIFYQLSSAAEPQIESVFPLRVQYMQDKPGSFIDYDKDERGKKLILNCSVPGFDGHNEVGEGLGSPWQRIKWTEKMVKLLIAAVSYMRQFALSNVANGKNESSLLQKIGKWKLVSKIMVERGYNVSPQQCEDKFNNLNKSYKRLNDVLGRGTSCKVVKNPKLLDEINISEKTKENVRKILSSKQLFFEEMCSYHNGNQLYLPHDSDLQRSLQLALRKKRLSEPHSRWSEDDDFDEQDQDTVADAQYVGTDDTNLKFLDYNETLKHHPQYVSTGLDDIQPEDGNIDGLWQQWMAFRSCRLKLQKLQVKAQMLKLENQRFKWQSICWKQDRHIIRMRLENERLKIENERMAMELKYKKMRADYNSAA